jgi:hypothetical protein
LSVLLNRISAGTRRRKVGRSQDRNPFQAQIPTRSMLCFGNSGPHSTSTPKASTTSTAPQLDEVAREQCRTT